MEKIEELASPQATDDSRILDLIRLARKGVPYNHFMSIVASSPFSLREWSDFLHLSERTINRYRQQKKSFSSLHSEKILEIYILFNKGIEVFGDKEKFYSWLGSRNVALGGIRPLDLLDSSFGNGMINDELMRIEHGVLA